MSRVDFSQTTDGIIQVLEREEPLLSSLSEDVIASRFNKQNRTIKQILGHLIDSASNNTHRIIHLQYQSSPLIFPDYANLGNNDRWIAIQDYQTENWNNLLQLWKYSNLHIIHVINYVDQSKLNNEWLNTFGDKISLRSMIEDYLPHLHLHINEIHELCESNV